MTPAAPGDQFARRRREIARRHHPDRGGDPAVFVAEMERLAREASPAPVAGAPVSIVARRRPWRSLRRSTQRLADGVRARLPRHVPGARRYGRL